MIEDVARNVIEWGSNETKDWVIKFGQNPDVDAAEDIWDGGGTYSWPSAAATTTIVSSSTEDDPEKADTNPGTGAWTVCVQGLDANWMLTEETATLNGTAAVTLSTEYLRVFRAFVETCGTNGTNVGNIQVKHGATVLAQITAGYGQTLMCIYTVPNDYSRAVVVNFDVDLQDVQANNRANIALLTREAGKAWRVRDITNASVGGTSRVHSQYDLPLVLAPKTDIRIRVLSIASADSIVAGSFGAVLIP